MSRRQREGKYCGFVWGKHYRGSGPRPHKVCVSFAALQALFKLARHKAKPGRIAE